MSNNFWVIDVLQSIRDVAQNRGLNRIESSIEHATDEFLDDVEEEYVKNTPSSPRDHEEIDSCDVVVEFLTKRSLKPPP